MSDVRCTGKKCRGTYHSPDCETYKLAMTLVRERAAETKGRAHWAKDTRKKHDKLPPEAKLTPEQRSERLKGKVGRKAGIPNALPQGMVSALKDPATRAMMEAGAKLVRGPLTFTQSSRVRFDMLEPALDELIMKGTNVKAGSSDAARVAAGIALKVIGAVAVGAVKGRKAPSMFKGSVRMRDELCDPIVQRTDSNVAVNMSEAVLKAQREIAERERGGK